MSLALTSALSFGESVYAGANGASGATLPTMFDMQTLPDVAPSWMWTANISGVPGLPAFNNLVLADCNTPFEGFSVDPKFIGGFIYNFPKFISVTGMTMTFHELQTYLVSGFFAAWKAKIFNNRTGNWGIPPDYYGQIVVTLFDGMGIPAMEVTLVGCWPDKYNDIVLSTNGSSGLQTSVNLSVNRSNITYLSATLLDSPLGVLISGNPIASLQALSGVGLASLQSTFGNTIGKSLGNTFSGAGGAGSSGTNFSQGP